MKAIAVVLLLLMGLLYPCWAENPEPPLVVLANSIDRELNADFVQNLSQNREVVVVNPAECEVHQYRYIIILGGTKAPDTGVYTESVLRSQEDDLTTHSMIVTLNVWKNNQVVIVLAGPDREATKKACETHLQHVVSLIDAVDSVSEIVGSAQALVFLWPFVLSPSDQIAPFAPLTLPVKMTKLPSPVSYSLKEENWFFWIDDCPSAKFAHPTRFVFYSITTGACNVHSERWWPVLNGVSLWVEASSYWNTAYWVWSAEFEKPHFYLTGNSDSSMERSKDRALIVNGWSLGQPLGSDMAEDERAVREALMTAGVNVETASTSSEITQVLITYAQEMNPGETLLIYITAHGNRGIFLIQDIIFTVHDLVTLLSSFDEEVHIHIILDTCGASYSIPYLKSVAELIIAATGENDAAYGDCDPTHDINPGDRGSEFTSGLVITIKELIRTETRVNQWKIQAASQDYSWYILLLKESFRMAQELDANALSGMTTPVMWIAVTDLEPPAPKPEGESGCPCGGG